MQLARVKGTVVSTNKAEKLYGLKLLLVKPIDIDSTTIIGNISDGFEFIENTIIRLKCRDNKKIVFETDSIMMGFIDTWLNRDNMAKL